ncbi:MAG: bifunctional oligoribonuclease/PAP phosphatase NrnA [Oscillospiraceae bacterium]|jgi:phosphoesterase RecJ-like protein|nr:bifunctional oligoribonuclease/PAP phosphatase NrnA [Oscillospiraceae bacterium]
MMNHSLHDLIHSLRAARRIAILLHISPDGDTLGSALALCRALVSLGKAAEVYCDDAIPRIYQALPGAETVRPPEAAEGAFDLALAVDVADRARMGRCAALFDRAARTAQIDHHGTNTGYAGVNLLQSPLSASGVLALAVIDALGAPLSAAMAECLYVAAATDTGNFKQPNTDAPALRLAARCVETGFNPAEPMRRIYDLRPFAQVKLMGRAFDSLTRRAGGRAALMCLSAADFAACDALPELTEGIINYAMNIEGVRIACLLTERQGRVKCSLRSLESPDSVDVAALARTFGGGGHTRAAGCTLDGALDAALARMCAAVDGALGLG